MSLKNIDFPDFHKPPVVEVVCGVQFEELNKILAPHLGLLWGKFQPEYPICHEVPPLAPMVENYSGKKGVHIDFQDTPPLPRIWFIHKTENGLIQIQRDRFLYNWRKIRDKDLYPRYPEVMKNFEKYFQIFNSFLIEEKIGEIKFRQYEMTYINHMVEGDGWSSLADLGNIFPDFNFRSFSERFLPTPERINIRNTFLLPNNMGRLYVSIKNGRRPDANKSLLICELTVRGYQEGGFESWFETAREWIVKGFVDLTNSTVQKENWGMIEK